MSKTFGVRLRQYRQAAGLTMEELAEGSGVSVRAISDMERERSLAPQRRTVQALAEALGLPEPQRSAFLAAARAGRPRAVPQVSAGYCALPRPVPDFIGRARELARLSAVAASAEPRPGVAPVVTVSGTAGIGKTSLAVQAAHLLGAAFPDGTFFLHLRGMDAHPLSCGEALSRLLGAFGVRADEVPMHEPDRAGMYRDLLRDRRALVVLDNAVDEAQVRPLLPGPGPSLTLITSRRLLAGLEGVHRLNLAQLPADDAAVLLRRILSDDDFVREPAAIDEVVELCGRLPLALRIAGNRLSSRPRWTLRDLTNRLTDERRRLDQLVAGDLRIAAAFGLSYEQLSSPARRLFRRLALVPGPDFDARLAAVLVGADPDETEDCLDELVELSLLQAEMDSRYRFHDLVRLFARERLTEEEPVVERDTAHRRMVDWLLDVAVVAGRWFDPAYAGPASVAGGVALNDSDTARTWLEIEVDNWFPALCSAADAGRHTNVIRLAEALHWFSDRWTHWGHWHEVYGLSRAAAAALGDTRLEAVHLNYLAWAQSVIGQHRQSAASALTALDLARSADDGTQQAWALNYAAAAYFRLGEFGPSVRYAQESADLFETLGDADGYLQPIAFSAVALLAAGRPADAQPFVQRALAILDDPESQVSPQVAVMTRPLTLWRAGLVHRALGEPVQAATCLREAYDLLHREGVPAMEIRVLVELSAVLSDLGDLPEAASALDTAASLHEMLGAHGPAAELRARRAALPG